MRTAPQRSRGRAALLSLAFALTAWLTFGGGSARADGSWATTQAAELTRQGDEHATRGDLDVALARYLQAIGLDATFGRAYLGLGRVRELGGDPVEAERAYSMGIEHVPAFADALIARAHLRARSHRAREALLDLELANAARPDDLATLGELRDAYVAGSALPAALGVARRMVSVAEATNDERALTTARISARALGSLVGEADPVAAGLRDRGSVRRALALFARRASGRH